MVKEIRDVFGCEIKVKCHVDIDGDGEKEDTEELKAEPEDLGGDENDV